MQCNIGAEFLAAVEALQRLVQAGLSNWTVHIYSTECDLLRYYQAFFGNATAMPVEFGPFLPLLDRIRTLMQTNAFQVHFLIHSEAEHGPHPGMVGSTLFINVHYGTIQIVGSHDAYELASQLLQQLPMSCHKNDANYERRKRKRFCYHFLPGLPSP